MSGRAQNWYCNADCFSGLNLDVYLIGYPVAGVIAKLALTLCDSVHRAVSARPAGRQVQIKSTELCFRIGKENSPIPCLFLQLKWRGLFNTWASFLWVNEINLKWISISCRSPLITSANQEGLTLISTLLVDELRRPFQKGCSGECSFCNLKWFDDAS